MFKVQTRPASARGAKESRRRIQTPSDRFIPPRRALDLGVSTDVNTLCFTDRSIYIRFSTSGDIERRGVLARSGVRGWGGNEVCRESAEGVVVGRRRRV